MLNHNPWEGESKYAQFELMSKEGKLSSFSEEGVEKAQRNA